jgi:hypothetical protein
MRFRMAYVTSVLVLLIAGGVAHAQAALDDDDNTKPAASASQSGEPEAKVGFNVGWRHVWVPKSIIELFVDKAPGGASNDGIRFELSRRKGDFEVQLGFEYESISVVDGIWVQKGEDPANGGADHVFFTNFGWFSIEATFLNHTPINKYIALRYGGGAGLGILKGQVRRTDSTCTSSDPNAASLQTCMDTPNPPLGSGNDKTPYNLPPVFPVINAIIGLQIKPTENIVINIETGIRTLPFFGITAGAIF